MQVSMRSWARRRPRCTLSSVALLGAGMAPAGAADDGAVVQGPWTVTVTFKSGDLTVDFTDDEWHLDFGDGCAAGSTCTTEGSTGIDDSTSMVLEHVRDGLPLLRATWT